MKVRRYRGETWRDVAKLLPGELIQNCATPAHALYKAGLIDELPDEIYGLEQSLRRGVAYTEAAKINPVTENVVTDGYKNRHCYWCNGNTPDDSRGNCVACGGPRVYQKVSL